MEDDVEKEAGDAKKLLDEATAVGEETIDEDAALSSLALYSSSMKISAICVS